MPPAIPAYPHIFFDDYGTPFIEGTTMKVVELVMAQRAHGWRPEELLFQYPHLALSQVHAALVYYWAYQDELDADIEQRSHYAEQARREASRSALSAKLHR